jgi:hypothetical protein
MAAVTIFALAFALAGCGQDEQLISVSLPEEQQDPTTEQDIRWAFLAPDVVLSPW